MNLNETASLSFTEISLTRSIRFWSLLLTDIPSIACSFFLLYYILTKANLRSALNNHAIILLLITSLFTQLLDVPLYLTFLHRSIVWPQTLTTCIVWWYSGSAMYNSTSALVAWLSFERHILVFHDQYVSTRKKRWLFHYIPMIFVSIYPTIFYTSALLIPSCDERFFYDFNQDWCSFFPCYYNDQILPIFDLIANSISPCLLITFFSITFLMRVVWTKNIRLRRAVQWRRYRKMIIQFFSISSLFLLFNLPLMIYFLLYVFQRLPLDIDPQIELYLTFIAYFSVLFLPFAILLSLPDDCCRNEWRKLINYIQRYRPNVRPILTNIPNPIPLAKLRTSYGQNRLEIQ